MGREIVNSRQSTVMDSLPLAARRTNCIRWSSTSTSFQDIVSSLPARNSNPRCKGCLGNDCKGCHGTAHFRWPRTSYFGVRWLCHRFYALNPGAKVSFLPHTSPAKPLPISPQSLLYFYSPVRTPTRGTPPPLKNVK